MFIVHFHVAGTASDSAELLRTSGAHTRQGPCPNDTTGRSTNNDPNEHVSSNHGKWHEGEAGCEGHQGPEETGSSEEGVMDPRGMSRTRVKEESGSCMA